MPCAKASRMTRRDEYAQATRQAILDAARQLFAERGYFATKVDDIAAKARVAPATVYAVTGGKYGLLSELIRIWTTDPIVEATTAQFGDMTDAVAIIRELAAGSRAHARAVRRHHAGHARHRAARPGRSRGVTGRNFGLSQGFHSDCAALGKASRICGAASTSPTLSTCSGSTLATRRTSRCTTTTAGLTSARSIGWRTKLAASCYPNPVDAKADAGHPRSVRAGFFRTFL